MSKDAAKIFANDWYETGDEKSDTQKFWMTFLRDIFEIGRPEKLIDFEVPVPNGFIDAYLPKTRVLIEQKSFGVDLSKKILQSDGKFLTPYEQAQRYAKTLREPPRWIVTCNFNEFRIYKPDRDEPTIIKLRDLRYQYERLRFLIDPNADDSPPEEKISAEALEVISKIYDAFAKNYQRNKVADYEDALNKICTRLVFCLYAGDAHIFDANQFFDYLQSFNDAERNAALQNLFDVLNTPENLRGNLSDQLKNFPYVNGGLFDEKIALPAFNKNVGNPTASIGTFNARKKFSWHEISPPVFGAMFESTFSKENRQRASGMYYTSVENIHKVIDPLFLDDLRDEFEIIKRKQIKNRAAALLAFQDKISNLQFLDPACGSGNFLTETYLSLRRLENEILEELRPLIKLPDNPIKVSIAQFYGIEINSFAVAVAQTALWIAENQMLQETEGAIGKDLQALPLKNFSTIVKANALRLDWKEIIRLRDYEIKSKSAQTPNLLISLSPNLYIIGNPPFVGYSNQSKAQKDDLRTVYAENPKAGKIDYVAAWYKKAADFIQGTAIRCAFVSTNSIVQGEQCADVWKILYERFNIHVDFAHQTFKWLSDSENMAHVHCVVIGFSSAPNNKPKKIFDGDKVSVVDNINFYLTEGEIIFVEAHNEHIQGGVPKIVYGNKIADGGNLIIEDNDLDYFIKHEPDAKKFIYRLLGADSFIKGKKRYCLWLEDFPLNDIKNFPLIDERVEACRQFRLQSSKMKTRADAATPHLFQEIRQPKTNYIFIPRISSERRRYIPIDFLTSDIIATDAAQIIPDATLYHFGTLTSSIHMAWVRRVCGRLEMRYNYSATVVYNNFVWCSPSDRQRRMIERSAQNILDVRADFSEWTFAQLYDEKTMPDELRLAHKANDYAVALAYGFEKFWEDEPHVVAELMKLYKVVSDK